MKYISGTENLIKWRTHNCYTGGTVPKSNRKIVQKVKLIHLTPNTWTLAYRTWYKHFNET